MKGVFRRALPLLVTLAPALFCGVVHGAAPAVTDSVQLCLDRQLARYPKMQADDVYKLLLQATRGPGHLGVAEDRIRHWLKVEQSSMGEPWPGDTLLLEPIGGGHVRLHLFPYLQQGGTLASLAHAQSVSARVPFDSLALPEAWSKAMERAREGRLGSITFAQMSEVDSLVRVYHWPAIHHSRTFTQTYRPHYRVLTREQADSLLGVLHDSGSWHRPSATPR